MFICSVAHCIIIGESASTNGSKCLILCFIFILTVGEMETSDLYETFLDFFL